MFNDWLLQEMNKKEWSQADLARASGLTTAAISKYISGRIPEEGSIKKIAHAFKLPPEQVFRAAGILPPEIKNDDGLLNRINHLYRTLQDPSNKTRALEYLEFLTQLEEKNARRRKKP